MINNIEIGRRIKDLRAKLNLTQEKLAEDVDISYNYISIIENGRKSASLKTLAKISEKLGVSLDYLVFGKAFNATLTFSHDEVINRIVTLLMKKNYKEKMIALNTLEGLFKNTVIEWKLLNKKPNCYWLALKNDFLKTLYYRIKIYNRGF